MTITNKRRGRPGLAIRKNLLIHNYDLFLERQARLFATANSKALFASSDIHEKRNLLLLDDLTIFAIAGRRLLDLCGLKTAANKHKISPVRYNRDGTIYHYDVEAIGFVTLLNRLIHMSYFMRFDSLRTIRAYIGIKGDDKILLDPEEQKKDMIDCAFLIMDSDNVAGLYMLKDVIEASVDVSEKIVSACETANIYLDYSFREP
jgi:hypothetical protein